MNILCEHFYVDHSLGYTKKQTPTDKKEEDLSVGVFSVGGKGMQLVVKNSCKKIYKYS